MTFGLLDMLEKYAWSCLFDGPGVFSKMCGILI
jgi:hypothetical protein